ncbi:MAG TPA: sodium:proton antiporter, partial [Methylocella sp.]|nr:sodium:proton antiporter [Methylocella sp.]
ASSFAKAGVACLARLMRAGLIVILFAVVTAGAAPIGQKDRWSACRGTDSEARITACTEILSRGNQMSKRNRIAAYINRSSAYRATGDLGRAIADLDQALQLNPKSPLALTKRAAIYRATGDLGRAIADYNAAIALRPKSAAAFLGRAEAYRAKNDLDDAIADFSTALSLDKNQAAAYGGRAGAYRAKGDFDKAIADLDKALLLDPESALIYAERGAANQAKADLDHAIADYSQAIERDPKLAKAYNGRGLAFFAKGDFTKALADFSAALERDPDLASAHLNRANVYLDKQDFEPARRDLLAALKLDPQLAPAKEALEKVDRLIAASATPPSAAHDHGNLPWPLALPFAAMLLSIALGPLVVKEWWHIHYEKAAAFWTTLAIGGLVATSGFAPAAASVVHSVVLEYVPFILMLFALYTAAGGISVEGELAATPLVNTSILLLGVVMASLIGTTGASMILIRPLIRANSARAYNTHIVVFFIFLVSNIGGSLTPLGDPPLFLGFLHGIHFFWTTRTLWPATLFAAALLLFLFFLADSYFYRHEIRGKPLFTGTSKLRFRGLANVGLIGIAVLAITTSGVWHPGIGFEVLGTRIELQNVIRELIMVLVGLASLRMTSPALRAANGFEWEPIREVAYLFAGIFICIIPVMAMLQAGTKGPFSMVYHGLTQADGTPNNPVYFWATGLLSSFLDNAPTYLVFFQFAGGDPVTLTGPLSQTLMAISLGAVFMGANTYIGNAPNFMVYAIARRAGISMPGFFPYMVWSASILLPLFAAVTWLFLM